jgi:mannose-6-phosphate isomerase-like protein (cupin superfamily)
MREVITMRCMPLLVVLMGINVCGTTSSAQTSDGQFRRVVTGYTEDGKSVVVSDGEAPRIVTLEAWPGFASAEVWATDGISVMPTGKDDPSVTMTRFLPDAGGTRFRIVKIPPSVPDDDDTFWKEYSKKVPDLAEAHEKNGMHTTDSVDYGIVLSGEICLELDDKKQVHLKAGDCVVQNGTRHTWKNLSYKPCVMAFVMIGAKRVKRKQ